MGGLVVALIASGAGLPLAPTAAQGPDPLGGVIDNDTPVYEIPISVDEPNSVLIADIQPTDDASGLDTLLYLVDRDGNILAENDDRARGNTSSRLEYANADVGDYVLIATRYKAAEGDTSGEFALKVELQPGAVEALAYDVSPETLRAAGFPEIDPRPAAEWTILAYYGGDTNLEPGIMNDFNEFELAGGSNQQVRIVALMDRTPDYTDASGNWDSARLFEINADTSNDQGVVYPPTLDTPPLADLDERNMGDGQTLAQFLAWAIRHYPAQHYVIAFGSHGAGWQGLITDDTGAHDILSIPELRAAFQVASDVAGTAQFDLLINDACLMSSVEYHAAMADYFMLSFASPEVVVDPALDMTLFANLIGSGVSLPDAGQQLVDTYMTRDIDPERSDSAYLTNAVTDLTVYPDVVAAVEAFAALVNTDPAQYATWLGEARANTYTYTAFLGYTQRVDVGDFMRQVMAVADDPDLDAAAQRVLDALSAAALYGQAGERVAGKTTYYNIYFPDSSRKFTPDYLLQSPLVEWGKMLRGYFNAVTPRTWTLGTGVRLDAGLSGDIREPVESGPDYAPPTFHAPRTPQVHLRSVYPPVASTLTEVNIQMEIIGRNLASGTATVDRALPGGTYQRLNVAPICTEVIVDDYPECLNVWDSGVDLSTFTWNVRLPVVSDGVTEANELIVTGDTTDALAGRYREPGATDWQEVSVIFGDLGTVQRVVAAAAGSDALGTIRIPEGSEFQTFRAIVTPDGRTVRQPGTLYIWPPGGLELYEDPAPSGTYRLGVEIAAFGGVTGFDALEVQVDNDNVDPALQGYTDLDWGFTLIYSDEWAPLAYYPDEVYLYSTNYDETSELFVLPVDTDATDAETVALDFLESDWVAAYDEELEAGEVGGLDAVGFYFDYEDYLGDSVPAAGFSVYHAATETPLVFFVNSYDPDYDDIALDALDLLIEGTTFFAVPDDRLWTGDYIIDEDSFPVVNAWYDTLEETEFGLRYMPPGGDGFTFADMAAFDAVPGDDATTANGALLTEFIEGDAKSFEVEETRSYRGDNYTWAVSVYTAERSAQPVYGRLYTLITDDILWAFWFEAPVETAATTFADVFEIMLDGFRHTTSVDETAAP